MKLNMVMQIMDEIAPFALAEAWDHSGLRLGSRDAEILSIAAALDPAPENVARAAALHCNLLITHHPLMFSPPENLVCDTQDAKAIAAAFAAKINVAACHTNLDSARGGVNEHLAGLAQLSSVEPLLPPSCPEGFGMGAFGTVEPSECGVLCDKIARAWNLSGYRLLGSGGAVRNIALGGGACGEFWRDAARKGADLFITADMKYHECLGALNAGLRLMICDHGEMENPAMLPFVSRLERRTGLPVHFLNPVSEEPRPGRWRDLAKNSRDEKTS